MGIDVHNLHFLAHGLDLGVRYTRTVTIGRQALFAEARDLQTLAALRGWQPVQGLAHTAPVYGEPLLQQWMAAQVVDAVDASAYENASIVHDMNLAWPADGAGRGSYDAVLDFGCLEHVFDFPTAWRNCVDLCKVGGHVFHALPANNLSGHGFYQFSPELFFNLYQPERGFELRALYFAQKADPRHWWRVASPMAVKRRVNLCNSHEVYLLVLARKLREPGALPPPQQSDYAQAEWLGQSAPTTRASRWQAPLASVGLLDAARRGRERWRALRRAGLDLPAPDYERLHVQSLLRR
jgi:SAM-dependent methyltransferase